MRDAVPEPAVANVLDYVAAWNGPDTATAEAPRSAGGRPAVTAPVSA